MADKSKIEWTQATWNPVVGCTIHAPECAKCYAMAEAYRKQFHPNEAIRTKFEGTAFKSKAGQILWTGRLNFSEKALVQPLRRRIPTTYFVNSLSDLFHEGLDRGIIAKVFAVMAMCGQHTFQILTKRDEIMLAVLSDPDFRADVLDAASHITDDWRENARAVWNAETWPLPNVHVGQSIGSQPSADAKRENFRATPAAVKFVSYEPAIGPVDWTGWEFVDQIISGGESGKDARPSHPDWHRATRDFCAEHGIAYFFKQWGEWVPDAAGDRCVVLDGRNMPNIEPAGFNGDDAVRIAKVGKKRAGRLLDGVEHNGRPA